MDQNTQEQNPQPQTIQQPVQEKPKTNKLPIIILSFVTIASLVLSGFLFYQNIQLKKQPNQASIPQSSDEQTPATWKTAKWTGEGNLQDAQIDWSSGTPEVISMPTATYNLEYPSDWEINTTAESVNNKNCFVVNAFNRDNTASIKISEICTGWSSVDDKIAMPKNYSLLSKKTFMGVDGKDQTAFVIRDETQSGSLSYIEGTSLENNIQTANFTDAVIIRESKEATNRDTFFTPVNVIAVYETGTSKSQ